MSGILDSHRETRDNLGSTDETRNLVLIGTFQENLALESGPTRLQKNDIGNAFILGSTTNAILGTSRLGDSGYVSGIILRVVNTNNVFHEHFRYTTFNDTSKTTGNFDVTNHVVILDFNEMFWTTSIFLDETQVQYVTPNITINGGLSLDPIGSGAGKIITITEGS